MILIFNFKSNVDVFIGNFVGWSQSKIYIHQFFRCFVRESMFDVVVFICTIAFLSLLLKLESSKNSYQMQLALSYRLRSARTFLVELNFSIDLDFFITKPVHGLLLSRVPLEDISFSKPFDIFTDSFLQQKLTLNPWIKNGWWNSLFERNKTRYGSSTNNYSLTNCHCHSLTLWSILFGCGLRYIFISPLAFLKF